MKPPRESADPAIPRFSPNLPLWYQLCQQLRSEILTGKRRPGERLDSEVRMAERHGMSVVPVRQALRLLEKEALIVRLRGSGTYVSDAIRPAEQASTSLESLYAREFTKPAMILERGTIPTPVHFAPHFDGVEALAFVRRLAFRDGTPWSYGTLYFLTDYADKLTNRRLVRYPLYRLMREQYQVELTRSHFEARAVAASAEIAHALGLEPFSPALSLMCVTFDAGDRAVGAFDLGFPSDPFVFRFETPHALG